MPISDRPMGRRRWLRYLALGGALALAGCTPEGEGTLKANPPKTKDHRTRLDEAKAAKSPTGPPGRGRRRR